MLLDDPTIPDEAALFRVLHASWTTNEGGNHRPISLAFFSAEQEISYFVEAPGVLAELQQRFPGLEIARVPVSVMRGAGFAIERRPAECPEGFQCDPACHVVAGPNAQISRKEYQKRAGVIAKHQAVTIIAPEAPQPAEAPPPPEAQG